MRIVVISDSHRKCGAVYNIIEAEPTARHIFFLGDVVEDIEDISLAFPDRIYHIVSGNCDGFSQYPTTDIAKIGAVNILYTHGHRHSVKSSVQPLVKLARERECKIVLFGHTHIARVEYQDGIYIVNPGSCAASREGKNSYAVIDIEDNGIMPIIKTENI